MIQKEFAVNFGSRRASLSTVGYRLINPDGTTKQARATTGVAEIITATGLYSALVTLEDTWEGQIVWDTGEATPLYAVESFDMRTISGGGSYTFTGKGGLTAEELKKIFTRLDRILKNQKVMMPFQAKIKEVNGMITSLGRKVESLKEAQAFDAIKAQIVLIENSLKAELSGINKSIPLNGLSIRKQFAECIEKSTGIIKEAIGKSDNETEIERITESIEALKDEVGKVFKEVELTVKIGSKTISTEDLQVILKEGGADVPKIPFGRIQKQS